MNAYKCGVSYITYYKFYKPGSLSTPVHVALNSSFSNVKTNLNLIAYVGILKPMTWGEIGLEAKITKKLWT